MTEHWLLVCLCQVLKGDQEVGCATENQDRWILLFTKDPVIPDLFQSVGSGGDKGENNLQLSR